jgi:hypothetical protein
MAANSNQLLLKRLIKEIKRDTGGTPGPDSVGTSQIINGTITTADISDGAITQAKFSPELQLALAEFDATAELKKPPSDCCDDVGINRNA